MYKNEENTQLNWIENLRAFATFGVILIHTTSEILYQYNSIPNSTWWIGNFFDSLVRFSVPVFLMITGALLIPKEEKLRLFLSKRMNRILIPLMFWSIVYISAGLFSKITHDEKITLGTTLEWLFFHFKHGASFHFWYLYMLVGMYLFIPIIGKWARNSSLQEIRFFLLIWFSTLFINQPILENYFINIDLTNFTGYIGYIILGYYLSKKEFASKQGIIIISILLIISGTSVTFFGTYFLTKSTDIFVETLYFFLTPNVALSAIGVFLLFKTLFESKINTLIKFISKYSFGIYFIHILTLALLSKFGLNWKMIHPVFGIVITSVTCLTISTFIIFILQKIPFGKKVTG